MKNLTAIVEKTGTGYSAYIDHNDQVVAATTGTTLVELKFNLQEALNLFIEVSIEMGQDVAGLENANIQLQLDVPHFFEYYKTINVSAFSEYTGLNRSLLSQYATGKKQPSEKQSLKIIEGIHKLGKEYLSIAK